MTNAKGPWQLHNHPGGLIHEMDTTDDDDYLLAVYWWGKPAETDVNYAYSHGVQEQGSCFKRFRAEHSDLAHSCPEMERPPWAICTMMVCQEPATAPALRADGRWELGSRAPERVMVSQILGPSAGRRLKYPQVPVRFSEEEGGSKEAISTLAEEEAGAVEFQRTKLFADFDAKAKAAWRMEFEADAAEIHRLLAQRAAERVSTGKTIAELEATISQMQVTLVFCRDLLQVWSEQTFVDKEPRPTEIASSRACVPEALHTPKKVERQLSLVCSGQRKPLLLELQLLLQSDVAEVLRNGRRPSPSVRQAAASFSTPISRLDFTDAALVGAGYDLVDVRVLTSDGAPVEAGELLWWNMLAIHCDSDGGHFYAG
eukprot:symbB.v1.2.034621.t1/scaffold4497.1/size38912/3